MRPFRFGVQLSAAGSGKEWRDKARKAEDLGFSTLYIPDHFGDQLGPLVALTVAAEATTTLNVGTLVFDNDYRHPVVLAKEAATLDLVTEGRFEFGIGAGWMKTDYDESGMPYDAPGVRITRMVEGLQIMKSLWRDGTATFKGEHYDVTAAHGFPRPHTPGGPKVVIGGGGERVLRIAAREADIIGFNANLRAGYVGPEVAATAGAAQFKQRVEWVKDEAGSRFDDIELSVLVAIEMVVPNRDETFAALAPGFGITPEEAAAVPIVLCGTVEQICDDIVQRREEYGFTYVVVHDLDAFAPIVAKLAGT